MQSKNWTARPSTDPHLARVLAADPFVQLAGDECAGLILSSGQETVQFDPSGAVVRPLECLGSAPPCRTIRWAHPATQLIFLSVAPLVHAGLLLEPPGVMWCDSVPDTVGDELLAMGWEHGFTAISLVEEATAVLALNALLHVRKLPSPQDLDRLYEAAYGSSTSIRCADDGEWAPVLAETSSELLYRLRFSPGEDSDLLTVQWMGNRTGRLGATGMIQLAKFCLQS